MDYLSERNQAEYDARKKSLLVAYLLLFFVGWTGAHRFYLGRPFTGAIMLCTVIMAVVAVIKLSQFGIVGDVPGIFGGLALGLAVAGLLLAWIAIDIFVVPGIARDFNMDLVDEIYAQRVVSIQTFSEPPATPFSVELHPSEVRR